MWHFLVYAVRLPLYFPVFFLGLLGNTFIVLPLSILGVILKFVGLPFVTLLGIARDDKESIKRYSDNITEDYTECLKNYTDLFNWYLLKKK